MSLDAPKTPREEMEVRLTALLLGELPADEAAALQRAIEQDAELARLHERLKQTIGLVREAAVSPMEPVGAHEAPLKLSSERRQKLLAHFKTVAPKEFAPHRLRKTSWLVPMSAAAALVALAGLALFWTGSEHRMPMVMRPVSVSVASTDAALTGDAAFGMPQILAYEQPIQQTDRKRVPVLPRAEAELARDRPAPDDFTYKTEIGRQKALGGEDAKGAKPATPAKLQRLTRSYSLVLPTGGHPADVVAPGTYVEGINANGASKDIVGNRGDGLLGGGRAQSSVGGQARDGSEDYVGVSLADGSQRGWFAQGGVGIGGARGGSEPKQMDFFSSVRPPELAGKGTAAGPEIPQEPAIRQELSAERLGTRVNLGQATSADDLVSMPLAASPSDGIDPATGLPLGTEGRTERPDRPPIEQRSRQLSDEMKSRRASGQLADTGVQPRFAAPAELPQVKLESSKLDAPARSAGDKEMAVADTFAFTVVPNTSPVQTAKPLEPAPAAGPRPTSEPETLRRLEAKQLEAQVQTVTNVVLPPGFIDLQDADLGKVLDTYQELTGRTVMRPARLPEQKVTIRNQAPLTRQEAVQALDGVLSLNQITMIPQGEKFSKALTSEQAETAAREFNTVLTAEDVGRLVEMEHRGRVTNPGAADAKQSLSVAAEERRRLSEPSKNSPAATATDKGQPNLANRGDSKPAIQPETLRRLEALRLETQAEHEQTTELYRKLTGPNQGELKTALATASPEPQLADLLQQLSDDDRVNGVSEELDSRRASSKAKLDSLQAEVDKAKQSDIETAIKRQPYFQAKRDLEDLQMVREKLNLRIIQEKVEASIPKIGIVKIVDRAEAQPTSTPTLGQRIKGVFTGGVEKSARIAVEKNAGVVAGLDFGSRTPGSLDPYWIQSQFEALQSKPVLEKVIEKLNLNEAWAAKPGSGDNLTTEETLKLLKKRLNVSQDRKSNLIDIRVKSEKPEEAALIANTIAEAFRDYRLDQQMAARGISALEAELGKQEKKLTSATEELELLQTEVASKPSDVSPTKPASPPPVPQPEIQTRDNAFSTFSLNVSDVSFKLAAASLEKGQMPEPATVRSEEFINAFDYRDPEPPPGVPIGFAWERARYPFAHNRDLLRFSIKTAAAGRQPGRPLNLVLLLDNSGSMERADRVRIINEALRVLAKQLQPQDKISLVAFARTARLWMDGVPGSKAGEMAEKAGSLTPQGGTNLEDAMNLAYQTARRHYLANGINRVVLLTDGAANLGNVQPEALKQKVEAHRKQGIALDCFGVGWEGFNDDLLEILSRNGDGRYGFINTEEDAATEFAGQLAGALKVAASDVKVQLEFNPARVTAYRQIGYAKHQLTKEQFRDNTVDAAEIGAAESGNALYVVEANPRGQGPLATVRVRFKVPGTVNYREHEWAVPYSGNAVALEQASLSMRLAASASAFSEWLVSSPYAAEVTPDRLLGYLGGVSETCGADERPKKLEWMIRQTKSIAAK